MGSGSSWFGCTSPSFVGAWLHFSWMGCMFGKYTSLMFSLFLVTGIVKLTFKKLKQTQKKKTTGHWQGGKGFLSTLLAEGCVGQWGVGAQHRRAGLRAVGELFKISWRFRLFTDAVQGARIWWSQFHRLAGKFRFEVTGVGITHHLGLEGRRDLTRENSISSENKHTYQVTLLITLRWTRSLHDIGKKKGCRVISL